jgi:hypothetical protein
VSFFRPLPFAIVEHLASELQSAVYEPGDDHPGRGARRALLHHRGGPYACRQGRQATPRDEHG